MYISFFWRFKACWRLTVLECLCIWKACTNVPPKQIMPCTMYPESFCRQSIDNRNWRWKSAWRSQRALSNGPAWASAIITLTRSLARSCNHSPIHALPHSFTQFEHKSSFGCETEPASTWGEGYRTHGKASQSLRPSSCDWSSLIWSFPLPYRCSSSTFLCPLHFTLCGGKWFVGFLMVMENWMMQCWRWRHFDSDCHRNVP